MTRSEESSSVLFQAKAGLLTGELAQEMGHKNLLQLPISSSAEGLYQETRLLGFLKLTLCGVQTCVQAVEFVLSISFWLCRQAKLALACYYWASLPRFHTPLYKARERYFSQALKQGVAL